MTLEQLVTACARLRPADAALQQDSALCVTPIITQLIVDGALVSLSLDEKGRWGAGYVRVSDIMQRSAQSAHTAIDAENLAETGYTGYTGYTVYTGYRGGQVYAATGDDNVQQDCPDTGNAIDAIDAIDANGLELQRHAGRGRRGRKKRNGQHTHVVVPDGYSEEEQITRQVRFFVQQGLAFRIYSDAGITGEYPINDPRLIQRLLSGQARRYEKIFRATLLDDASRHRRGQESVAQMEAYLEKRLTKILQGSLTDEDVEKSTELDIRSKLRLRSGKKKALYRQGLTQLWEDIGAGLVKTIAVSDRSRLCRAVDMESELLGHLQQHGVRLIGLIEDLSRLDVSNAIDKGMSYLIGAINEYRLEEVAGHALRGVLQLLESGRPNGRLPWWLERDENGFARLLEGRANLARRIVDMALSGMAAASIAKQLRVEGVRVDGQPLTRAQIRYMLQTKALAGYQGFFGLDWPVYVRVVDAAILTELQSQIAERAEGMANLHNSRSWAEHLFTGLCFCACGSPMFYQHGVESRSSPWQPGYYACFSVRKASGKDASAPLHSFITEAKLAEFLSEIFRENPNIIANAMSAEGDRTARRRMQIMLIEEQLKAATASYEDKAVEARRDAEEWLKDGAMAPGDVGFDDMCNGRIKHLLRKESARIAELQQERALCLQESNNDRRAERALAAVDDLAGWDDLDTRSKNRLLRAIFASITIYALGNRVRPGRGGFLELRLAGIETPLPPVKMRRGYRRGVDLPSAAEWIASMFASEDDSESSAGVSEDVFRQFHAQAMEWSVPETSDELRESMTAILTRHKHALGRKSCDPVPVFWGIVWRFITGAKWNAIDPVQYAAGYTTCHRYFKQWMESGQFQETLAMVVQESDDSALCRFHASVADGSFARNLRGK